ncbi:MULTISPECIES: IS4 family transposase [Paraburkholderia]|uniref:IS4 family transposase n=1 Tax=Paraburkholderia TaxID=1822464 RepID=UPI00225A80A9|nr:MULTISPECIES: IS4 family transposase [Paraburkholderia]MCX4166328.1 IS4 family transposase [Paraburkholderia megapolitana]MDN7161818.1 IS4 family transposase [Paraburkholderia sp. CHISQ3]MDQ6498866.1 IS4 family transposase [Paraburkholderia megapolitana]
MARTRATLGQGIRLSDHLGASLFARVYPMEAVVQLLERHGCNSQRVRRFPASTVVYFSMALSLYPEAAYEDVFAAMTQGLAWLEGSATSTTVSKASITEARTKIGAAVLRDLQAQCCPALAVMEQHPGSFYAGLRLVAMDGSSFDVPDEQVNADAFGYPEGGRGPAGYPKAQCAVLVECGTHAILAGSIGAYRDAEWTLCQSLLPTLDSTMLCMADRGFNGFEHWQQASQTGAQLLWRVAKSRNLPVRKVLEDGSFLSTIYRREGKGARALEAIEVRVIEYALPNMPESEPRYRLMTTLLDPLMAPAKELAALYHARWHVESVFDELKTHLRQSRRVLRSKTPDLVCQEFYGWMLAHYAVRWLMHSAARQGKKDPLDLSFTEHVHLFRRAQPQSGAFPPSKAAETKTVVRTTAAKRRGPQVRQKSST